MSLFALIEESHPSLLGWSFAAHHTLCCQLATNDDDLTSNDVCSWQTSSACIPLIHNPWNHFGPCKCSTPSSAFGYHSHIHHGLGKHNKPPRHFLSSRTPLKESSAMITYTRGHNNCYKTSSQGQGMIRMGCCATMSNLSHWIYLSRHTAHQIILGMKITPH